MSTAHDDLILNMTWLVSQSIRDTAPTMTEPQSEKMAGQIVRDLLIGMGGHRIYLPKKPRADAEKIRSEFNGRNITELANQHGLSKQRIYQILK